MDEESLQEMLADEGCLQQLLPDARIANCIALIGLRRGSSVLPGIPYDWENFIILQSKQSTVEAKNTPETPHAVQKRLFLTGATGGRSVLRAGFGAYCFRLAAAIEGTRRHHRRIGKPFQARHLAT